MSRFEHPLQGCTPINPICLETVWFHDRGAEG